MKLTELAARRNDDEAPADLDYQRLRFDYQRSADQDAPADRPVHHPVVVVGAGPVGLALAIDLAQRRVPVVLLDNDDALSTGSRAICFAKRTLEIFDRLGCGDRMADKGVKWNVGKVFHRDREVYRFDLLPEAGHERPAFVNLQQYYVEGFLAERAAALPAIDLRWKSRVTGVEQQADHAILTIDTPDGPYRLVADHVVACDGSRSALRQAIGQESKGRVFRDRFLIADVKMTAPFPAERWFWFDPPFHPNQSVLLHMQPDGVWRIDFQLGWDADPEKEKRPENILPRVRALLGADTGFELEWASVYTFACQRMERFRHGRIVFAGDSAHGVSPFGARGANSGVQDADNLGWKLALVVQGRAPEALLDSYAAEREAAADENIRNSTRATDFITPKSQISRLFRDAALDLAKTHAFARGLVNSGRLSLPSTLHGSPLNTPDADAFDGRMVPGAPAADAPLRRGDGSGSWLLRELGGEGFTALVFGNDDDAAARLAKEVEQAAQGLPVALAVRRIVTAPHGGIGKGAAGTDGDADARVAADLLVDTEGLAASRYDAAPGAVYLLRPDQHVCARWRRPSAPQVRAALERARAIA